MLILARWPALPPQQRPPIMLSGASADSDILWGWHQ